MPAAAAETVRDILLLSGQYLAARGVPTARREAEWLMAEALGVKRLDLYLRFDEPVAEPAREQLRKFLKKRASHMPREYIIGYVVFMGLRIEVDASVPIPRPETELLVEYVRGLFERDARLEAADVGTGSGAIAAGLLDYFSRLRVLATDISAEALAIARRNIERIGCAGRAEFVECDLLPANGRQFDLIVANLPYVSEADYETLAPEVKQEPKQALLGGPTGCEIIERLIALAPQRLRPAGWLVIEMGHQHAQTVRNLLARCGLADIRTEHDYGGIERIAAGRKPT